MDAGSGGRSAGGILGRDFLTFAGAAATLGIAPASLLHAGPAELAVYAAIASEAARYARERDEALANRIITELAEALKRGK